MPIRPTDTFHGVINNYPGQGLLLGWKAANLRVNNGEPVYETVKQFEASMEHFGAGFAVTTEAQHAIAAINENRPS